MGDLECWLRPDLSLFLSTLPPWFPWAMFCPARFPWGHLDSIAILNALLYMPTPPRDLLLRIPMPVMEMTASDQLRRAQEETAPHARCPLGPTTVPLGRQIIISTGKLYFSRCKPASCLWSGFSCWTCEEQCYFLGPGPHAVLGTPQAAPRPLAHLQVFQFLYQGPGTDEALIEEREDGRAFQDSLPESPPRTCSGKAKGEQP